jgi:sterol desaturase/sphingolipid hydroxylase (fatty acid hydroxylase superfamily)
MPIWLQTTLDALTSPGPWRAFGRVVWAALVDDGSRYLACILLVWGLLHVLLRKRLAHRLISAWPSRADLRREITYSVSSLLVTSAGGAVMLAMLVSDRGEVYEDPLKYGWTWLLLSLPVAIVLHDFYFYWTHRLLHTRWLFRHVHAVHHRSRHPSPWAALSFHPVEALVQGAPLPLILLVVPLNDYVIFAFLVHQMLRNAYGHGAVEILPRGFARHWFWGRFATCTHHHLHHETARGNYSLWFTWWDRWLGTERAEYLARFDAATAPRPAAAEDGARAIA